MKYEQHGSGLALPAHRYLYDGGQRRTENQEVETNGHFGFE